jgi:1,4-alpha-glucan branching enzyme
MLGSKKTKKGFEFRTYAPNAKEVKVYINGHSHDMVNEEGYWYADIKGIENHTIYTYQIDGVRKCDPYTNQVIEIGKLNVESMTYDSQYEFKHQRQIKMINSVYEVYLKQISGDTYQEKAYNIVKGAEGYTHIQIMPFNFTPNKKTLGYKTSTYFAPEPKYGELDDLKEMIDILHENGLGVILDFSIFEFEEFSNTGLKLYDGTTLFERKDKKQHPIFTGFYFDIEKPFVRSFLKDVINFLVEDLQADGIRIDGLNEVAFINKGETQDINEEGLAFIKEILSHFLKTEQ